MKSFKNIPFNHEGKEYEIRIFYDDSEISVVVFFNHHPVNGYRYQIKFSKNIDIEKFLDVRNFDNLIDSAKNDILNNSWERFLR
jgi:hypothetical protein